MIHTGEKLEVSKLSYLDTSMIHIGEKPRHLSGSTGEKPKVSKLSYLDTWMIHTGGKPRHLSDSAGEKPEVTKLSYLDTWMIHTGGKPRHLSGSNRETGDFRSQINVSAIIGGFYQSNKGVSNPKNLLTREIWPI